MRYTMAAAFMSIVASMGSDAVSAQTLSLRQSVPHITTYGYGQTEVVPDEALISLGVSMERQKAPDAAAEAARAATAMIAEIKAQGITAPDIKTTAVDLSAVFDEEHDATGRVSKRTPRGYRASESLSIRVRDIEKAGKLAQAMIDKGANQFSGIRFSYSKERETQRALQADAMRDALAEAKNYTSAIGLKLGRVIQIGSEPEETGGAADLPSRRPVVGTTVPNVLIPVEPGSQTITASISVTWEIENGP